jgi:hypothetical protein
MRDETTLSHWCKIAPALHLQIEGDVKFSFDFDSGLRLTKIPDWLRQEPFTEDLGTVEKDALSKSQFALMAEFEAARLEEGGIGHRKHELIILANLAMWLSKPSPASFSFIVDAKRRTGPEWSWVGTTVNAAPLLCGPSEKANSLSQADFELARQLYSSLSGLKQYTTLWTAMQMSWLAVTINSIPLRYLTFWVSLESLFGPKEAGETTFKLSQRMALFLSADRVRAKLSMKIIKDLYAKRSEIAHGSFRDAKKISESLARTESLVRTSLKKMLLDTQLIQTFNSKEGRDTYLSDLPYSDLPYSKKSPIPS